MLATPPVRLAPTISFAKPKPPTSCFQYEMSAESFVSSTLHNVHSSQLKLTLRLNLNQLHARILRAASVHAVLEVAEPGRRAFAPDLFDARVGVGGDDGFARHGDPVLVAGVGEGNAGLGLALLEVGEFLAVRVGQEEEVRSRAFGDGHGAGDGLGRRVS